MKRKSVSVTTDVVRVLSGSPKPVYTLTHPNSMGRHPCVIPDALKNFDLLPDSANVRQPVVQMLIGCSAATIWRMVKRGTLPAPRKLSERITCWNVGALRKAIVLVVAR